MKRVRIPQIKDISTAIWMYHNRLDLSNSNIEQIFDKPCSVIVAELKKIAMAKTIEKGMPIWDARRVNTKAAYEAWELDINDLEQRHKKLKQFEKNSLDIER